MTVEDHVSFEFIFIRKIDPANGTYELFSGRKSGYAFLKRILDVFYDDEFVVC